MNPPICENESDTLKYFSGELPDNELSRVEDHITECGACYQIIAHLTKVMNPETSEEENAFLAANFEESVKEINKLVKETLAKESETQKSSNVVSLTDHKQALKKASIFSWKASHLAFAASLAIIFLVGVIAIYQLRTVPKTDPLINESLAAIQEINLKSRPTKLRFAELEFASENTTRGSDTETLKNKLKASRYVLENLVASNPTSTNLQTLAQVLILSSEYDKALEQLSKAIKVDKTNPSIFTDIALCQAAQNDYKVALESINKALSINKNYLPAIFNRALIYQELKQLNEARLDWETYLQLDSTSPWAVEAKKQLDLIK